MAAYLLALIDVTDPEGYKAYTARTPDVIAKHGGRFIVRGGNPEALEGKPPAPRVVLIEFKDKAAARAFYQAAEYQEILPLRLACAKGTVTILEGA